GARAGRSGAISTRAVARGARNAAAAVPALVRDALPRGTARRDRALRERRPMTLPRNVRDDFPLLGNRPDLVYLDTAATSQKPRAVLEAMQRFYETSNANVRRGVHRLGEEATEALEQAREAVRRLLRARSVGEVVFTRGTTESINLVAQGWLVPRLQRGDEIVVTELQHHSNLRRRELR